MTDSAVDMADSADTAVRAVSMAIVRPVQKVTGLAAGLTHGASALRTQRSWARQSRRARRRQRAGARPLGRLRTAGRDAS